MSGWDDVPVVRNIGSFIAFPSRISGFLKIPPIPFFTVEEEDYMVEQYGIQGFKNSQRPSVLRLFHFLIVILALQFYTRSVSSSVYCFGP